MSNLLRPELFDEFRHIYCRKCHWFVRKDAVGIPGCKCHNVDTSNWIEVLVQVYEYVEEDSKKDASIIDVLRLEMWKHEFSPEDLAANLGLSILEMNYILAGKDKISEFHAKQLAIIFKTEPEFWLNLLRKEN